MTLDIQHSPNVADGRDAFLKALGAVFNAMPELHMDVKRVAADGDLVWIHALRTLGAGRPNTAVIDICRVKGGRIVEHWAVLQPMP